MGIVDDNNHDTSQESNSDTDIKASYEKAQREIIEKYSNKYEEEIKKYPYGVQVIHKRGRNREVGEVGDIFQ